MTAPFSKLTIYYNYKGRGFSENFWSSKTPAELCSPDVPNNVAKRYMDVRLPLLDDDAEAVYARASVVGSPRKFEILPLQYQGYVGKQAVNGSAPDDAVILKLLGSNGEQGLIHIHAFPASIVKETVVTNLGSWGKLLNTYLDFVKSIGNGFVINTAQQPGGGLRTYYPVLSANPISPRGFIVTTAIGPTFAQGDVLSFSRMGADTFGYNGRKIVQRVAVITGTPNVTELTLGGAAPVGVFSAVGGRFFKVPSTAVTIAKAFAYELGERKTGKVFGVPAGRRPSTLRLVR